MDREGFFQDPDSPGRGRVTGGTAREAAPPGEEEVLPVSFEEALALARRLDSEVGRVIVGQEEVRRQVLACILAGGHCLLRGVPGLAKTLLVRTLAGAMQLRFGRIQFTPDLMPSDVVGTEVMEEDPATGRRSVRFLPGPIFCNVLLADEINRTPPRTQAALLEAMQEYQVTIGGVRHALERPLFVLATENPIEQEGTYPLPEAQLDRFLMNVVMDYPQLEAEREILAGPPDRHRIPLTPVATGPELEATRSLVRGLPAASNVVELALRIVRATRPGDPGAPATVRPWIAWGAGPRGGQSLLLAARAWALLDGRRVPEPDDVVAVALPVLRHRIVPSFAAEADGISADEVVREVLAQVRP
jgi:MoxR-like ATPase